MTATVSFSNNHLPAIEGYQSSDEVDLNTFMPVYQALRAYLDVDPVRRPFEYAARVLDDLKAAGWPPGEARRYAHAARLACFYNLDPTTGEPLTGIAAVHPVYVETAADEVAQILEDVVANDSVIADAARRIVARIADLGWRPAA